MQDTTLHLLVLISWWCFLRLLKELWRDSTNCTYCHCRPHYICLAVHSL